jgi:iron complex transport system permease protein
MSLRSALQLTAAALATLLLFLISLSVGGSSVGMNEALSWLARSREFDSSINYILSDLRLPRTLACLLVGANLGFAGGLLQTLLKNPLAEPYTLGLSGGATLGAVLAILLQLQPAWLILPLFAVTGCLAVTAIILKIAWRESFYSQRTLILCGVMISLFCGSLVVLLMTLFDPYQIQTSFFWMLGQLGSDRDHWWPMAAFGLAATWIWSSFRTHDLDRLLLGD